MYARADNLRPETILAMAQVIVTLHNDMLRAPMKGGFALLNDKVPPARVDNSALFNFGEMARISPWINKQGALVLDFVFDIGLKNARCVRNGRKGGKTAQILAREGAIASGAPPDASGRPTNKAAMDWLLMGAEEGARDMTWEQIEEEADKVRAKGGAKGGTATQIVARAGVLVSGAPRDASGRPTNKAAMDWLFMGAEEGTRDMTWEQIEEGADKLFAPGCTSTLPFWSIACATFKCIAAATQTRFATNTIRIHSAKSGGHFRLPISVSLDVHICIFIQVVSFSVSQEHVVKNCSARNEMYA